MRRDSYLTILLGVGCAAALAACSASAEVSTPEPEPVAIGDEVPPPAEPQDPDDVHIEGDHITIDDHILFALNSDEILPESGDILDHLAQFLANHRDDVPGLKVIGHTDRQGGKKHNQQLSEKRAAAVVAALEDRGVTQPLEPIGKGMSEKLCQEDTDECHDRNRRVEFLIVSAE
jgi:outer membrane protein OmpA-like peptidoglycan-associated protein